MLNYIKYIDQILSYDLSVTASFSDTVPTRKDYEKLLKNHTDQIIFFQHERLIHLIVTVLFAILTFAVFFLLISLPVWNTGLFILLIALLVLLIPYIAHYYILENGVQKMYKQYDEILKRIRT